VVVALALVTGLALASVYILISLSFTLILAASGVFNFVQGSLVMLGTILAYVVAVGLHLPSAVAMIAALVLGSAAGLMTEVLAVRPIMARSRDVVETTLITTLGIAGAIDALTALGFGSIPRSVPSLVTENPVQLFEIPIRPIYIAMALTSLIVVVGIELLLRRTEIGRVFRITLEDREAAALLGINVRSVIRYTFMCAGALAMFAGVLIAPVVSASAFNAIGLAFAGFAAMAIGGFGSIRGTLLGGLIVGVVSGVTAGLLNPNCTAPILVLLLIAVLIVRPTGLLGSAGLFGAARAREV
jgi:branched-subunit amino acid ABC-type transport system permease component